MLPPNQAGVENTTRARCRNAMHEFNTRNELSEEEHELTLQMKNKTLENVDARSQ